MENVFGTVQLPEFVLLSMLVPMVSNISEFAKRTVTPVPDRSQALARFAPTRPRGKPPRRQRRALPGVLRVF